MSDLSSAPQPDLITGTEDVRAIAAAIAERGAMAFDIEFVSADRFIPELSLIQVAWGPDQAPEVAAIDCLAADPAPIFALIARSDIDKVAHAPRQDLGLLAVRYGVQAKALWDTQIAAAFAGLGDQCGYANLVRDVLGVRLDKGSQFTAWLSRPLSAKQIRYALDDVRYILPLWHELKTRLAAMGRQDWVAEESARLVATALPLPPTDEAYKDVKGWRNVQGKALAQLRELAGWRQQQAVAENKPLSWIVPDPAMIELCQRGIASPRQLQSVRGIGDGTTRRYGDAIVAALARGAEREPPPAEEPKPPLSARAHVWAAMLASVIQAACVRAGIAPRFVGTRADAEALAVWHDAELAGRGQGREPEDIDLLRGWRRELIGETALAWLRGEWSIAATADAAGIALLPAPASRT